MRYSPSAQSKNTKFAGATLSAWVARVTSSDS
jgi:hypothetical protein